MRKPSIGRLAQIRSIRHASNVIGRKLARRFRAWNGTSVSGVWDRLRNGLCPEFRGLTSEKAIGAILMRERPPFLFRAEDSKLWSRCLDIDYVETTARNILRHRFPFFGKEVSLNSGQSNGEYAPINWHCDVFSGHCWPSDQRVKDGGTGVRGADIRVAWELNRFYHFPLLGKAYFLALHERCSLTPNRIAEEFQSQCLDWLDQNPVKRGVNWSCAMEVGIRAVNWSIGFYFFRHASSISAEFWARFLAGMFDHADFLWNNLENDHLFPTNHYLADLIGLFYIATCFPEFSSSRKWGTYALEEFARESKAQFCADGVQYEGSLNYHRFSTEIYCSLLCLCRAANLRVPRGLCQRVEKMLEFVHCYTMPNGQAPMIGDFDESRLHYFSEYGSWIPTDHRYLLGIGAELFGRDDFRDAAGPSTEEGLWMAGGVLV